MPLKYPSKLTRVRGNENTDLAAFLWYLSICVGKKSETIQNETKLAATVRQRVHTRVCTLLYKALSFSVLMGIHF